MRRNGRAATSAMLVGVLVFQTACMESLGPIEPLRPGDAEQREAIERAYEVRVRMVGGGDVWLNDPSVTEESLIALRPGGDPIVIPVDSITEIQALSFKYGWLILAVPLAASVITFIVIVAKVGSGCISLCGSGT